MPKKKEPEFTYCIARKWYPTKPWSDANLCKYSYGGDTFRGTMKDAQKTLEFLQSHIAYDEPELSKEYRIVKITYEVIE